MQEVLDFFQNALRYDLLPPSIYPGRGTECDLSFLCQWLSTNYSEREGILVSVWLSCKRVPLETRANGNLWQWFSMALTDPQCDLLQTRCCGGR